MDWVTELLGWNTPLPLPLETLDIAAIEKTTSEFEQRVDLEARGRTDARTRTEARAGLRRTKQ